MRQLIFVLALFAAPASAQHITPASQPMPTDESYEPIERTVEQDFVDAANLCLTRVMGGDADGAMFDAGLRPASEAARTGHPFGGDPNLRESAHRADGKVTVRFDNRTCSVFAVGAASNAAFESLAASLHNRGGFAEQEIRGRAEEGRVQRTFRQVDGRTRVEMEGFLGGMDAFPGGGDLAMAHIGRR